MMLPHVTQLPKCKSIFYINRTERSISQISSPEISELPFYNHLSLTDPDLILRVDKIPCRPINYDTKQVRIGLYGPKGGAGGKCTWWVMDLYKVV